MTLHFNAKNIGDSTDIIHDKWFFINDILFLKEDGLLKWPIYKKNPYQTKDVYGIISFSGVDNINIVDTEEIGSYDFNYISFSSKNRKAIIHTNFPLKFEIYTPKLSFAIDI